MQKRMMALAALVALLAMVLVMLPAAQVGAQTEVIEVDGLFYGIDPDTSQTLPDKELYLLYSENPGRGALYYYQDGTSLYLAVVVDPSVNDNVFGDMGDAGDKAYVQTSGWKGVGNQHHAEALISSDNVEIQLACGGTVYDWFHGYLYDADGDKSPTEADWLSGYGDGSTGGGDGSLVLASASSLMWNLNYAATHTDGWDVTLGGTRAGTTEWKSVDADGDNNVQDEEGNFWGSPAGDGFDDTNHWEWAMVYETEIDVSACESTWAVSVPSAHNSPPKSGDSDVPLEFDYGDLPDSPYPTYWSSDGARHLLVPGGPILGFGVDADIDGQPEGGALGDDYLDSNDDEDGVIPKDDRPRPNENFTLAIAGTAGAWLDAFFDWNQDGDFDDPGETYSFQLVTPSGTPDPNNSDTWPTYDFMVPSYYDPSQQTVLYARFRVSTAGGLGPDGAADDGEVEDYTWSYSPTAVVLASFTASAYPNAVLLEWQSATEFDMLGYRLERADAPAGPWSPLPEGSYAAQAPGGLGAAYEHSDWDVKTGRTYYYRLVMLGTSGTESYFGPVSATVPTIGEPLAPPSPAGVHRVFLPFIHK